MTRFTITGRLPSVQQASVTWTDGVLSGDAEAVAAVGAESRRREGHVVGWHMYPLTLTDHLSDPRSACILMSEVFAFGRLPRLDIDRVDAERSLVFAALGMEVRRVMIADVNGDGDLVELADLRHRLASRRHDRRTSV